MRSFDHMQLHELHLCRLEQQASEVVNITLRKLAKFANDPCFYGGGLYTMHLTQDLVELSITQQKIGPS